MSSRIRKYAPGSQNVNKSKRRKNLLNLKKMLLISFERRNQTFLLKIGASMLDLPIWYMYILIKKILVVNGYVRGPDIFFGTGPPFSQARPCTCYMLEEAGCAFAFAHRLVAWRLSRAEGFLNASLLFCSSHFYLLAAHGTPEDTLFSICRMIRSISWYFNLR
jgi:hypothetical protein